MGDVVGQRQHADAEPWARVQSGDGTAFEEVYLAHADALFVFCLRRLGSFQDAEDVVARTFEELWKQHSRVVCDPARGLRPWLYTVARRMCGRMPQQPWPVATVSDDMIAPGVDVVVEDVLNEQAASVLIRAIARLDGEDQVLARHSFVDDMSSGQIGKRLGMPASTVRSRLARIRAQLERDLEEAGYGPGGDGRD